MVVHKPLSYKTNMHSVAKPYETWLFPPVPKQPSHLLPCGGRQATHFCTRVLTWYQGQGMFFFCQNRNTPRTELCMYFRWLEKGVISPRRIGQHVTTNNGIQASSHCNINHQQAQIAWVCYFLFVAVSRFYFPSASMTLLLFKVSCVRILRIVVQLRLPKEDSYKNDIWYNVHIVYFTSIEHAELMLHMFLQKHVELILYF